ncbi:MAG: (2Fe-2S)-binding protein [Gammaproteobacteria bacterium]|nr:(2Fe-2S)-binding protein [Gammaproteobacteria bacterium]
MTDFKPVTLEINGRQETIAASPNMTLLEALRELNHFEVKCGCEKGDCGACAVLIDGEAVDSCLMFAHSAVGKPVTTLDGLTGNGDDQHPLKKAFVEKGAIQCGYCIPGMVIAAQSMLNKNPNPTRQEMREGLGGNLCRCTGYNKIFDAIEAAAAELDAGGRD